MAVWGLGTPKIGFLDPENPGIRSGNPKIDQKRLIFDQFWHFLINFGSGFLIFWPDFELLVTVPIELLNLMLVRGVGRLLGVRAAGGSGKAQAQASLEYSLQGNETRNPRI